MATFAKEAGFCLQPEQLAGELAIHRMIGTELDRKLAVETDIQRHAVFAIVKVKEIKHLGKQEC